MPFHIFVCKIVKGLRTALRLLLRRRIDAVGDIVQRVSGLIPGFRQLNDRKSPKRVPGLLASEPVGDTPALDPVFGDSE